MNILCQDLQNIVYKLKHELEYREAMQCINKINRIQIPTASTIRYIFTLKTKNKRHFIDAHFCKCGDYVDHSGERFISQVLCKCLTWSFFVQ